jgi:hypothetical protein
MFDVRYVIFLGRRAQPSMGGKQLIICFSDDKKAAMLPQIEIIIVCNSTIHKFRSAQYLYHQLTSKEMICPDIPVLLLRDGTANRRERGSISEVLEYYEL